MSRYKGDTKGIVPMAFANDAQTVYITEILNDPRYSTLPDPEGKLGLTDDQKRFIVNYLDFRNLPLASQFSKISEEEGVAYFQDYKIRNEIRRINTALYQRKFARRLLTLDEIGGYLTSQLIDADTPECDRLDPRDKLKVAQMIIDINQIKAESFDNPNVIEYQTIDAQMQDMSVEELNQLLAETKSGSSHISEEQQQVMDEKMAYISIITEGQTTLAEEYSYLRTLSLEELKEKADAVKAIKRKNKKKKKRT
jgi:ribosomal protein L29